MKILHVITGLGTGGAEQHLRSLLRYAPGDADVVVLTNPGVVAEGLRSDGVPPTTIGMRSNHDVRALVRLFRLIRNGRYDVVHTHLFRAQLYGGLAARLAGVPAVVTTEHSLKTNDFEGRRAGHPLVRMLYRLAAERHHEVLAVSVEVRDEVRKRVGPRTRITVVPLGIDIRRLRFDPQARRRVRADLSITDEQTVVGAVGRLVALKKFDVLVEALTGLPESVVLMIVGTGPAEHDLRTTAALKGVAHRVRFTGELADVGAHLSAMDLLASPCEQETFGLAVLEGLGAGLPVLYASSPALDDYRAGRGEPSSALPSAVRVESDAVSFRRAITAVQMAPGRRFDTSEIAAAFDIARSAAELGQWYAKLVKR